MKHIALSAFIALSLTACEGSFNIGYKEESVKLTDDNICRIVSDDKNAGTIDRALISECKDAGTLYLTGVSRREEYVITQYCELSETVVTSSALICKIKKIKKEEKV